MNTITFWDNKKNEARTVKVTQSKQAMWRNQAPTRRNAFALAKHNGWVHITSRTTLNEMFGRGVR